MGLVNIDIGTVLSGAGKFLRDVRTAITGKEPLDANKVAELALEAQRMENTLENTRISVMVAEASSPDKWTSRARPSFLYVFYVVIVLLVLVAPFVGVFFPSEMTQFYVNVGAGFKAIPDAMWATFTMGYLGYTAARQYGKYKVSDK
jgi:hypothetical protein